MNCETEAGCNSVHNQRCGITSFELLVALSLFMTALLVTTPLMVRHGRLLVDQRRYRIALDEVSNHLDRLGALPTEELAAAVAQLKVDDWTLARLPGAALQGHLEPADIGSRITLELSYGAEARQSSGHTSDAGPKRKSVTLESWVAPRLEKSEAVSAEDPS